MSYYKLTQKSIESMSIGYITNTLIFIQRTGINKEKDLENLLREELKKRTLIILK